MKQIHKIKRRVSRQIFVGDVAIGGDAPISVQSMTNTDTCDVDSTVAQIISLEEAGADICLLYTSPSPRDQRGSRMPSSA